MSKLRWYLTFAVLVPLLVFGIILTGAGIARGTPPNPDHKVTICHAHPADSLTGPWVSITVDVASVGYQQSGHQDEHDGDIIPSYTYTDDEGTTFSFEGKGDQAILANGCVAVEVSPTPTPTPTESPTPTDTPAPPPVTETPPPPAKCVLHPNGPECRDVKPNGGETAFTGAHVETAAVLAVVLLVLGSWALWYSFRNRL